MSDTETIATAWERVELVGGPLCGDEAACPVDGELSMPCAAGWAVYKYEGSGKAVYVRTDPKGATV